MLFKHSIEECENVFLLSVIFGKAIYYLGNINVPAVHQRLGVGRTIVAMDTVVYCLLFLVYINDNEKGVCIYYKI